jgi:hypothetical protein
VLRHNFFIYTERERERDMVSFEDIYVRSSYSFTEVSRMSLVSPKAYAMSNIRRIYFESEANLLDVIALYVFSLGIE